MYVGTVPQCTGSREDKQQQRHGFHSGPSGKDALASNLGTLRNELYERAKMEDRDCGQEQGVSILQTENNQEKRVREYSANSSPRRDRTTFGLRAAPGHGIMQEVNTNCAQSRRRRGLLRKGHIPGYSGRTCSVLFSSLAWVMCRIFAVQLAQVPGSSMGSWGVSWIRGVAGGVEGVSRHEAPEKEGWSHCWRQLCAPANQKLRRVKNRARKPVGRSEVGINDGVLSSGAEVHKVRKADERI